MPYRRINRELATKAARMLYCYAIVELRACSQAKDFALIVDESSQAVSEVLNGHRGSLDRVIEWVRRWNECCRPMNQLALYTDGAEVKLLLLNDTSTEVGTTPQDTLEDKICRSLRFGPTTVSLLAHSLSLYRSTVNSTLKRLEKTGRVKRVGTGKSRAVIWALHE